MAAQDDILYGIDAELKESQKPERFKIEAKQQEGSVWKVWLSPTEFGGRLDESLEGAYAWWPGDVADDIFVFVGYTVGAIVVRAALTGAGVQFNATMRAI